MNEKLIKHIQLLPGVITVEPEYVSPEDPNQITVTITFLNLEDE